MREYIEKKLIRAKRIRIALLVLAIVLVGSIEVFLLGGALPNQILDDSTHLIWGGVMFVFWAPMLCALSILAIIYLNVFRQFTKNIAWLKQNRLENIADDIVLDSPTLPASEIYCGQLALFSKRSGIIIPYDQFAWVHDYERRINGITVEKAVIINTVDRRRFALKAQQDEFMWLLANYIIPNSPKLIVGYGNEQMTTYNQLYSDFPNSHAANTSDVNTGVGTSGAETVYTLKRIKDAKAINTVVSIVVAVLFFIILLGGVNTIMTSDTPEVVDISTVAYRSITEDDIYYFENMLLIDAYASLGDEENGYTEKIYYLVFFVDSEGNSVYASFDADVKDEFFETCEDYLEDDSLSIGDMILSGCFSVDTISTASDLHDCFMEGYELYGALIPGQDTVLHFSYEDAETIEEYRSDVLMNKIILLVIMIVMCAIPTAIGIVLHIERKKLNKQLKNYCNNSNN